MRRDITGRPGHIHILTTYGSVCAIAPHPQEQRAGAGRYALTGTDVLGL